MSKDTISSIIFVEDISEFNLSRHHHHSLQESMSEVFEVVSVGKEHVEGERKTNQENKDDKEERDKGRKYVLEQ